MPATRNVYEILVDETGQPIVGLRVEAKLVSSQYLQDEQEYEVLRKGIVTTTDETGKWVLALIPNDLMVDENSYYIVIEGGPKDPNYKDHKIHKVHYIRVPSGTGDIRVSDILITTEDITLQGTLLYPGVRRIKVAGADTELTREVIITARTNLKVEQNVDPNIPNSITFSGMELVNGAGIEIKDLTPQPDEAARKQISVLYLQTPPPPIGTASLAGSAPEPARRDHTHEGVHSINSLVGDVTVRGVNGISMVGTGTLSDLNLVATQGLRSAVDPTASRITLKGTMYAFLPPSCWKGDTWAQRATFFSWTNIPLTYTATRGGNNITSVLTDNNDATYVAFNPTVGNIILTLSESDFVGKVDFKVTAVRTAGVVTASVKDPVGNTLYSDNISVSATGWYSITFGNNYQISLGKIVDLIPTSTPTPDIDISEIRIYRAAAYDAWKPGVYGSGPGYVDGWIICPIMLYGGWNYRYRIYFGVIMASTSTRNAARVEGRIYASDGTRTDFLPGTTMSQTQPNARIFVSYSGALLSPTADGTYTLAVRLAADILEATFYPVVNFLGMLIEYE